MTPSDRKVTRSDPKATPNDDILGMLDVENHSMPLGICMFYVCQGHADVYAILGSTRRPSRPKVTPKSLPRRPWRAQMGPSGGPK